MQFINQSILLKALGWSLISSLWQMGLLWLVYLLITGMHKRLGAPAKHNLAFFLSTVGSGWFVYTLIGHLLDGGRSSAMLLSSNQLLGIVLTTKKLLATVLPYLTTIYLATILFFFIRYIKYYLHLQQLKQSGLQKIQPALRLFSTQVSLRMGIAKKVSVWLSSVVESPMTIGFLKPIILIPIATVNHLTIAQVESILLHELTHIKRNDYLVNLVVVVSGIIFFFNPFARLFINTIKKEREHCCDDLVLQFQYNPHDYASALLVLEKSRQRHLHHHLAMAAIGKSNQLLLERVRRVTGHEQKAARYSLPLIGYSLLALVVGGTILFRPTKPLGSNISQPVKIFRYIPSKELLEKTFVTTTSPAKKSEKKKMKPTNKPALKEENEDGYFEDNVTLASNNESENDEAQDNILTAVQTETRDFTILSPVASPAPAADMGDYPYVPSSSFSYQIQVTDDTSKPGMTHNEMSAEDTREKALESLKEINWKKIQKQVSSNGEKVNVAKLQDELQKTFSEVNWNKINSNTCSVLSEADEKRIRENIQLQMRQLQSLRFNNTIQAQRLKQRLIEQRIRLQQNELNKRIQSIMNAQKQIMKELKIVYI